MRIIDGTSWQGTTEVLEEKLAAVPLSTTNPTWTALSHGMERPSSYIIPMNLGSIPTAHIPL